MNITFDQIKELMDDTYNLYYVDYNDNLNEQTKILQQCIHNNNLDPLYEVVDDWFIDGCHEYIEEIEKQIKANIESKYDIENAYDIMQEFEDEIREEIYNRDDSSPTKDLIRNTSSVIMFYDTGYYMESESWSWDNKRVAKERKAIKKHLKIKEDTWDKALDMMIMQASYGGNLEIYFRDDFDNYCDLDAKYNHIQFSNFTLGIINHDNGSGDICELPGCTITLPLNHKNIFIEKEVKYNWTYDIAGMCYDAYDNTKVELIVKKIRKETKISDLHLYLEKEQQYNKTYKEGTCTYGDKDMSRHRNISYYNEPLNCRNQCNDCKTVWID